MLDFLEKFNNLPPSIKAQVTNAGVMQAISDIGKRYQIELASLVMRVMVKDIDIKQLANYFVDNHNFDQARAQHLEHELKEKVFADVINYLYREPLVEEPTTASTVPLTAHEDDYWREKINKVIAESGVALGSSDLERRLANILLTYYKHIRDKLATLDAMTKPYDSGGLGLDKESATNLLLLVDGKRPTGQTLEIRPPARMAVPEDKLLHSRDIDYDLAKELQKRATASVQPQIAVPTLAPLTPVVAPETPTMTDPMPQPVATTPAPTMSVVTKPTAKVVPDVLPQSQLAVPAKQSKPETLAKPQPKPEPKPQPIDKMRKTDSGKVKMDDIAGAPRVFTPVDELRYMTLKNFRNLDSDPWQAIAKIKDKMEALKKEDYGKMVAGIKAWKQSPLSRLYLEVYQTGMVEGKPATDILQVRRKADAGFLTEDEFEAIIKLNQELKF